MATATEQQIPTGTYTVDKIHSTAGFAVKHMVVATFRGRFEEFDATLEAADDGSLHLVGTVDANSIVVKDENLAGHLKSPDFFDTEQYPTISFDSRSVKQEGQAWLATQHSSRRQNWPCRVCSASGVLFHALGPLLRVAGTP